MTQENEHSDVYFVNAKGVLVFIIAGDQHEIESVCGDYCDYVLLPYFVPNFKEKL